MNKGHIKPCKTLYAQFAIWGQENLCWRKNDKDFHDCGFYLKVTIQHVKENDDYFLGQGYNLELWGHM